LPDGRHERSEFPLPVRLQFIKDRLHIIFIVVLFSPLGEPGRKYLNVLNVTHRRLKSVEFFEALSIHNVLYNRMRNFTGIPELLECQPHPVDRFGLR
jgi:hypothetical protein